MFRFGFNFPCASSKSSPRLGFHYFRSFFASFFLVVVVRVSLWVQLFIHLGPNPPSNSPADLCEKMLRRCFAKRVQSGGACLVLLTKPCVRLADLCQGSMLKIQDQRRSLLKTLRGHRPPEVFGRGWQRQAQTRRRAKAGRGRGR